TPLLVDSILVDSRYSLRHFMITSITRSSKSSKQLAGIDSAVVRNRLATATVLEGTLGSGRSDETYRSDPLSSTLHICGWPLLDPWPFGLVEALSSVGGW